MQQVFDRLAAQVAAITGSPPAFLAAVSLIVVWLGFGPFVGFLDTTYQLIINSATTIITFLMVFLLQSSQNRDAAAIQLKLDALILANQAIDNRLLAIEKQPLSEIAREAEALRQS